MRLVRLLPMVGAGFILLASLQCGGGGGSSPAPTVTAAPTAAFSFAPTSPVTGQTVTFTDASTGSPTGWAWTFGDGGTSTAQNPTHAYTTAGTYTVSLAASNAGGTSSPVTHSVTATTAPAAPTAAFSFAPTSPVTGQTVTFTDASTGSPTGWAWTFGDGGTSTTKSPTHAYATAGTYTVTLLASNAVGASTPVTHSVTVTAVATAPTAAFSFSPAAPTTAQTVTFTDASTGTPTGWSWTFGDGGTSTAQNPTHAFASAGTYTVTLTASHTGGSNTASHTITVMTAVVAPVAAFSFAPAAPSTGQTVTFTDASTYTPTAWSWTFGDGGTSAQQNPTHAYTTAGTYTVSLTATNTTGASTPVTHSLTVSAPSTTSHAALERPTELQYWDPTKAEEGYTFFGAGGKTYLLDMEGRVVHTWPVGTNPHLLANGNVVDAATNDPSGFGSFKEVDWSGSTIWSYVESRSTYHPHHDFTRIYNPKLKAYTTLIIANKDFTYAQLVEAGADPARAPSTGAQLDAIVEVDASGNIVWEWCFFDHLVQDVAPTKSNYVASGKTIADYPNRLNINLAGHNLKADWLHCNSLDYNQTLDQIVINSVQGEFYVLDHGNTFLSGNPAGSTTLAATSAGDFLYRFGDPARYNQGSKPSILEDWTLSTTGHKQLGGAHDIQWIEAGLSGAGHFLVFNNAEYLSEHAAQSYVMEINPYLDASGLDTGKYVNPPDAGYVTLTRPAVTDNTPRQVSKQVVGNYYSQDSQTLFSTIGCSAQRLPNGNTLICADTEGHLMEVTPAGETVWEYIVPVSGPVIYKVLGDRLPMVNSIFRAYRYKANHPALAGRTLTPGVTIAGRASVDNPYAGTSGYQAFQRTTGTQYWDASAAYSGYTFLDAAGTSRLIDMDGRLVHTWPTGNDPRLLANGNVLDWSTGATGLTGLKELDWNGNTVWQYVEARSTYHPHGAFARIFDPKLNAYATLYLANKDLTPAQCLAAGCDPADAPFDGAQVDTLVEVDMSGAVIWEWSFWDHAIQSVDTSKANSVAGGKTIADYPGKLNLNLPGRPLRSNWLDCNALDFNQALDQIVVNSRQGEFYIIDHGATFLAGNPAASIALAATSAGDFLYRFGDPARYGQGNPPSVGTNWETATSGNKQIGGSSDVTWIASGLSGAGNLLLFNNNQYLYQRTPQSYVFEVNPRLTSAGITGASYVDPPSTGYATWTFDKDSMKANQLLSKQVAWKYGSVGNLTLFSQFGGSVQRLPNGNTLICATTTGYLMEVTSTGTVVWEYLNPLTASGAKTALGDRLPMTNAVTRARRYAYSDGAFSGH